jgi:hypothetical protein
MAGADSKFQSGNLGSQVRRFSGIGFAAAALGTIGASRSFIFCWFHRGDGLRVD